MVICFSADVLQCNTRGGGGGGGTHYIQMIASYFLGVVIGALVFLGVVQAKSFKKIKQLFVRVQNRSFEYASLINSSLLVFFRLIFDQEVYFRVRKFYGLVLLG